MTKREKVIEALEACVLKDPDDSRDCKHCPRCNYGAFITNSCINGVMADALVLLKTQEPHWISVEDGLPQEHDTIFAKFYGTDKWRNGMFVKASDDVRVVKVFRDGTKRVHHDHTVDGRWESERKGLDVYGHVTHWMPNPELPFCTSRPADEQRQAVKWE